MNEESRICQNCKASFIIDAQDFDFYKKIGVSPPTWCPDCRLQRRLAFLNHRTLYKRKCNMCAKNIIAMYPQDAPFPVYCQACYWSDKWDAKSYGRDYNFSVPFFEQFKKLNWSVPHVSLMGLHTTLINSEYNNLVSELKNCYLLFNSDHNENCMYGSEIENSKECCDTTMIESCQLCYQGINLTNCYNAKFSIDCENCQNMWFSKNCVGCTDCVGCMNLKNKKYHIFNEPYGKEEYTIKIKELNLDSREGLASAKRKVEEVMLKFPNKFIHGRQNMDVSGDYINHSKNVRNSYIALGAQDCRYCMWLIAKPSKDCYDLTQFGENAERICDSLVIGIGASNIKFSSFCVDNASSIHYSDNCFNGNNLFGCSFMQRGNSYCILNKKYTKEEYEELTPRIIKHMDEMPYTDEKGRIYKYGEFFPPEISAFSYNETSAQEFFPITKEKALASGYSWREPETRNYQITIKKEQIPDSIGAVDSSILEAVIGCAHEGNCTEQCTTAFKITPAELQFYQRLQLPLPDLCPNCRSYQRHQKLNPVKLWKRKCHCAGTNSENSTYKNSIPHSHGAEHCPNEFETSYSPERKEIVYCGDCYNAEVA